MVVVLVDVCARNPHAHVVHAESLAARFGKHDAVERDRSLDVGCENFVQVAFDIHRDGEGSREVLVVDEVVQVGLSAGKCEFTQVYTQVKIVCRRIGLYRDVQVATVGEFEAQANIGLLVAQVYRRYADREILKVNFRANLCILVDNVAFLEDDVLDGNIEGEAFGDFCRIDHGCRIGGGGVNHLCGA